MLILVSISLRERERMRAGKPETMGCWIAIGLEQHRRKEMQRRFYSQVREMDWDYFSDLWGISDGAGEVWFK